MKMSFQGYLFQKLLFLWYLFPKFISCSFVSWFEPVYPLEKSHTYYWFFRKIKDLLDCMVFYTALQILVLLWLINCKKKLFLNKSWLVFLKGILGCYFIFLLQQTYLIYSYMKTEDIWEDCSLGYLSLYGDFFTWIVFGIQIYLLILWDSNFYKKGILIFCCIFLEYYSGFDGESLAFAFDNVTIWECGNDKFEVTKPNLNWLSREILFSYSIPTCMEDPCEQERRWKEIWCTFAEGVKKTKSYDGSKQILNKMLQDHCKNARKLFELCKDK